MSVKKLYSNELLASFEYSNIDNQLCLYLKIWKTLRIAVRMLMRNI